MKTFFDILFNLTLIFIIGYPVLMVFIVTAEKKLARLLMDDRTYPKGLGVNH